MSCRIRLHLAAILLILMPVLAHTETLHVPSEHTTIQAGLDAAAPGDTVLVASGTYSGQGNKNLDFQGKDMVLLSEAGPEFTVIDCENSGKAVDFISEETPFAVLDGFTMINGEGWNGGAIQCKEASPTIARCALRDNWAVGGRGGAIYCWRSFAVIRDCRISSNNTGQGGAIYCELSSPTISGCLIGHNAAAEGGAIHCVSGSSPTIVGCMIVHNAGHWGGALYCIGNSSPTLLNCTISFCQAVAGGGVLSTNSSSPTLENSIIAFAGLGDAVSCSSGGEVTLVCCDVYGNDGGDWVGCIADQLGINGNISEDPLFCDPENEDFRLEEGSPCAPFSPPDKECDLIGAWPVGCGPTATQQTTWGRIKAQHRCSGPPSSER